MNLHYDHPILLLQHMLWHEGYHHGQMKLALKLAGRPLTDEPGRSPGTSGCSRHERPHSAMVCRQAFLKGGQDRIMKKLTKEHFAGNIWWAVTHVGKKR
jgi:hypothetical protein